jgi:hypothetical protein
MSPMTEDHFKSIEHEQAARKIKIRAAGLPDSLRTREGYTIKGNKVYEKWKQYIHNKHPRACRLFVVASRASETTV